MPGIHRSRIIVMSCVAACALAVSHSASAAATINLSTHSSNSTDASLLSAEFRFEVIGMMLTLTVTNQTIAPDDFFINQIYFNGPSSLSSLTLTSPPAGWALHTDEPADGFGVFDYALIDGVGSDSSTIASGESLMFEFSMSGSAGDFDFVSHFSSVPPGSMPMIVAAKFVAGPGNDSAFGGTNEPVPAPAAGLLLLGLACGRRRRN